MKLISKIFQLLLIGVLACSILSCEQEEPPVLEASASFKLDDVNWISDKLEIRIERQQESSNVYVNVFQLTSYRNENSYLQVTINDVRDAQDKECLSMEEYWGYDHPRIEESYFLEDGGITYRNGAKFELVPSEFADYSSLLGEVLISDCSDNRISGSFSFTVSYPPLDTITVVKGIFTNQIFEFIN